MIDLTYQGSRVWSQDGYAYTFERDGVTWTQDPRSAKLLMSGGEISFADLTPSRPLIEEDSSQLVASLTWQGPHVHFQTRVAIDKGTGQFQLSLAPVADQDLDDFVEIHWPPAFLPMDMIQVTRGEGQENLDQYTVLPYMQGLLVPNDWEQEVKDLHFDGHFCSAAAYMPWLGQVNQGQAWLYILENPWDAKYAIHHPAGGPSQDLQIRWLPSLGKLAYERKLHLALFDQADYNDLALYYRKRLQDQGRFTSLADKVAANPTIQKLLGASLIHTAIKTHIVPQSRFYDETKPQANDRVVTFAQRQEQIAAYKQLGLGKVYVHLDGWAQPGYDNQHPDYYPACKEAGGWSGLQDLATSLQSQGDLIGLHDQYRDYYFDAPSFNRDLAVTLEDGTIPEQTIWAGGHQTYLCSARALHYVKRNFDRLFTAGIQPDCSYLDVFTCNEPDQCFHPGHRVTRKESLDHRLSCFAFLREHGIVASSEECADWAMSELVLSHYGPYEFMLKQPGSPRLGLPVPLFNLVYHDAMVTPWMMDQHEEDYMLYALLHAGMPYFDREGAYPNTDGSFSQDQVLEIQSKISRCHMAAQLQESLAFIPMASHRFVDNLAHIQEAVYGDGTVVRINLKEGTYQILSPDK